MVSHPLARGDVVLVSFPFTDLSGQTLRPAVIVGRVLGEDLIVVFVTSRTEHANPHTDVLLDQAHPDYARTGLRVPSLIRTGRVATLHRGLARRRIGAIGAATERAIAQGLRYLLDL